MYFVSFQPKDWRTCHRGRQWERDRCGFAPMYACLAETAIVTAIGTGWIIPSVPEVAVWFKSNDWLAVPKELQYAYVNGFIQMPHGEYMDRRSLAKVAKMSVNELDKFMRDWESYSSEFLFDPAKIRPIAEVDVKDAVLAFVDKSDNRDTFYKDVDSVIEHDVQTVFDAFRENGSRRTDEELRRMAVAKFWFETYIENGIVIGDYSRIVGFHDGEPRPAVTKVFDAGYRARRDKFNDDPTHANFKEYVRYMRKKFGVLGDFT